MTTRAVSRDAGDPSFLRAAVEPCAGGYRIEGTALCSHGNDDPPPGQEPDHAASAIQPASADTVLCTGDGSDGARVQLLYVRGASTPDRLEEFRETFERQAVFADRYIDRGAAETGGSRRVRFVHDGGCDLIIERVVIPVASMSDFDAQIRRLTDLGYARTDRKYLMWVDDPASTDCGDSAFDEDDSPGPDNRNNRHAGYARVHPVCWDGDGSLVVHELMHAFGAVMNSAPNSTSHFAGGGYHCSDEDDVMCYRDSANVELRSVCGRDAHGYAHVDCNHDDYFNTDPVPGSYLATHWNAADSDWLEDGGPVMDTAPPSCGPMRTVRRRSGEISVSDGGTGLQSITLSASRNANVFVPVFVVGTTNEVVVVVDATKPRRRASVTLTATDASGNQSTCRRRPGS